MKDLVILGTDSLFPPLTFISLSWGKERENKIKTRSQCQSNMISSAAWPPLFLLCAIQKVVTLGRDV